MTPPVERPRRCRTCDQDLVCGACGIDEAGCRCPRQLASEAVTPRPVTRESRCTHDRIEVRDAIIAGILVLRDRDGLAVTADQARERANNIVMAVLI